MDIKRKSGITEWNLLDFSVAEENIQSRAASKIDWTLKISSSTAARTARSLNRRLDKLGRR